MLEQYMLWSYVSITGWNYVRTAKTCHHVRVFINGIGKLDFLHLSKQITAKFFKHLSISSNVALRQVFYCYTVYGDKFLQLFHELNIQLDSSIPAIHKAVFSHFNHMCV